MGWFTGLRLYGAIAGGLALLGLILGLWHFKSLADSRGEKLTAICEATRLASDKPKLACKEVPLEIQYLGNAISNTRTKTAEAKAADAEHARTVESSQNKAGQESSNDYQAELARVRADYAERLRRNAATRRANLGGGGKPSVSGAPASAGGLDAGPKEAGLPPEDALTATEQAIQLKAIQDWARKVGLAPAH